MTHGHWEKWVQKSCVSFEEECTCTCITLPHYFWHDFSAKNTITKQKDNIRNEISFKWKCHATDKKQLYFLTIAKCLDYFLLGIIYVSWKTRKTNLTIVSFSRLWPDIYVFLNSLTCTSSCWRWTPGTGISPWVSRNSCTRWVPGSDVINEGFPLQTIALCRMGYCWF